MRVRLLLVLGLLVGGTSCTDSGSDAPAVEAEAVADLAGAWQVRVADPTVREPFETNKGWVRLVNHRDFKSAAGMLNRAGGLAAARPHAEAAGLYRQSALLVANAIVETYGKTPQTTDPAGVAHLLTVAHAVRGERDEARKHSDAYVGGAPDGAAPWHQPWRAWLEAGASWPPDLSSLPLELPAVGLGEWPELVGMPHYSLPERDGSTYTIAFADPGALVALAMWHDATAAAAAPAEREALLAFGGRYRLPVEGPAPQVEVPLELLFGSDLLVPGDAAFLADVARGAGAAAVDGWAGRSLLADLAAKARVDSRVSTEKAIDLAAAVRRDVLARMVAPTGTEEGFHRPFADLAEVGVLRALALVAEAEGDREASGVLRINAMERSTNAAACPTFLLSLAAWDAANRYPARGTDIVHNLSRSYPSLEAARYGLDVLALRVSRERVDQGVGM